MKLRHFVSGSSAVLACWLGVTFFNEVPVQRYPKLERYPTAAASGSMRKMAAAEHGIVRTEKELQVSVSP